MKPHIYFKHGCWWADWNGYRTSGITPVRAYNFLPVRFIKPLNLAYNERRHG